MLAAVYSTIMAQIRQYRPAYFSGFENETRAFTSLKELLNIEWVDNFRKLPNGQIDPNFHRYSISRHSDHKGYEYALMAEYKNGYYWWVVGFVDENEIIKELPVWVAKYEDGSK
jgi:hypothetical protein